MADSTTTEGAAALVLDQLTPEQEKNLAIFAANWPMVARPQPANRKQVTEALSQLYKAINLELPPIIWCEGPWHLIAIKALMKLNTLRLEGHAELIDEVRAQIQDERWQKLWQSLDQLQEQASLPSDFGSDHGILKQGSVAQEIVFVLIKNSTAATEKLDAQLSLSVKLKLRQTLRDRNGDVDGALRQRLLWRGTPLVVTQFGLIQIKTFLGDRLPKEFVQQLTPKTLSELVGVTQQKWPPTRSLLGFTAPNSANQLEKLFNAMDEQLNVLNSSVFDFQPLAYVIQYLPPLLADDLVQPIKDWLTLKENLFHHEMYEKICFVCEAPQTALLNERHQLHNPSGPAMTFRDGCEVYAWNGVILPAAAVVATNQITIEQIEKEHNVEVRRILIQQYGMENYLKDSGAVQIDQDEFGVLYRKVQSGDEPIVVVRVLNPTPEPDGTNKFYFLRVPPYITTARRAVAWTFDMAEQDYQPAKQS